MSLLTQVLSLLAAFALALLLTGPARAAETGKETFLEYKCNKCHSIESQSIEVLAADDEEEEEADEFAEGEEEIEPPDLSNAGKDFQSADEISEWVQKKLERNGRKHRSKFRGAKKDLKLLTEWVFSLRTE